MSPNRADMVSFVDRLEQAGALVRERDVTDRRRYSLRVIGCFGLLRMTQGISSRQTGPCS